MNTFASADSWIGGHYELAVELGGSDDAWLAAALSRLWSHPDLDGPYLSNDLEPSAQSRVDPKKQLDDRLFGLCTLPNHEKVPGGSFVTRFDGGSDWLGFYLPLAPLETLYNLNGYPFSGPDADRQWQTELNSWLIGIAKFLFEEMPFKVGIVGFEVEYAPPSSADIRIHGIPSLRNDTILWPTVNGLECYSMTP